MLHAAGHRAFRIHVHVAGAGFPVDSGGVRMLADGNRVGSKTTVTMYGNGTVRWNPRASTPRGTYRLTVRYGGADKDVAAGISSLHFRVRVR